MSKLIAVAVLAALALFAYQRAHRPARAEAAVQTEAAAPPEPVPLEVRARAREGVQVPAYDPPVEREVSRTDVSEPSRFHCDGRTYCSQMTSCEEATWFLENCPGVKMDGEGDGVPCERQWCGRR
jgi:hypothetical protein